MLNTFSTDTVQLPVQATLVVDQLVSSLLVYIAFKFGMGCFGQFVSLLAAAIQLISGLAFALALRSFNVAGVHKCAHSDYVKHLCFNEGFTGHFLLMAMTVLAFFMVVVEIGLSVGFRYTKGFKSRVLRGFIYAAEAIPIMGCAGDLGVGIGAIGLIFGVLMVLSGSVVAVYKWLQQ